MNNNDMVEWASWNEPEVASPIWYFVPGIGYDRISPGSEVILSLWVSHRIDVSAN